MRLWFRKWQALGAIVWWGTCWLITRSERFDWKAQAACDRWLKLEENRG